MVVEFNRKLILENGEEYYGYAFGSTEDRVCEVIFNTSVVGYLEIITDPSYTGHGVVMTYPLIGNYGVADEDFESRAATISALIVREYNDQPSNFRYTKTLGEVLEESNIPGIHGLDTRKLTRTLRDTGSKRALITGVDTSVEEGLKIIAETAAATDLVAQVSCRKPWHSRTARHMYNVIAIDCGIKLSLIRSLNARGCNVTVVPYNTGAEEILGMHPDGVLVSNGPGCPTDVPEVVETIKALRGKVPMFGTGLGYELIALAYGAKTVKLTCCHHGSNHAVRELSTGNMETFIQSHNYTVDAESIEGTDLTATYVDILDNTVVGLECAADQMFCVQFQPTDAEGPRGRVCLIDKFVTMMKEAKTHA